MLIGGIDFGFELGDFGGSNARLLGVNVFEYGGQNRSQVEQLMLHAPQNPSEFPGQPHVT